MYKVEARGSRFNGNIVDWNFYVTTTRTTITIQSLKNPKAVFHVTLGRLTNPMEDGFCKLPQVTGPMPGLVAKMHPETEVVVIDAENDDGSPKYKNFRITLTKHETIDEMKAHIMAIDTVLKQVIARVGRRSMVFAGILNDFVASVLKVQTKKYIKQAQDQARHVAALKNELDKQARKHSVLLAKVEEGLKTFTKPSLRRSQRLLESCI